MAVPVTPVVPGARRWARNLWPLCLVVLCVPVVSLELGLVVDEYDAGTLALVLLAIVPVVACVAALGVAIGGRRGLAVVAVLGIFVGYLAWWFGWGVDGNVSRFSVAEVGVGLADAASYLVALLVELWPFVLAAAVAVGVVARWRGWRVWWSLGGLVLALAVLAWPVGGSWSDSCNETDGSVPAIAQPFTTALMNHGIGVLPGGTQTLVLCPDVGDREWKPFWLGDDGLPPKPHLESGAIRSVHLPAGLPQPAPRFPTGRFPKAAVARSPDGRVVLAVVRVARRLPAEQPRIRGRLWDFELAARAIGNPDQQPAVNGIGACYLIRWDTGLGGPLIGSRNGRRAANLTYRYRGQILAHDTVTAVTLPSGQAEQQDAVDVLDQRLGCTPS